MNEDAADQPRAGLGDHRHSHHQHGGRSRGKRGRSAKSRTVTLGSIVDQLGEWVLSVWEGFLASELDLMLAMQRKRHWLSFLGRITSSHPLHDISLVVWATAAVAVPTYGYSFVFTVMSNLIIAFLANRVVGARCPGDVDARIVTLARVSPHGMPPVELVMATVVFGWLGASGHQQGWVWLLLVVGWIVVTATRVHAAAYFPHQVLMGVLWGIGGLAGGKWVQNTYFQKRVPHTTKLVIAVLSGAIVLAYIAYRAEHNGAPMLRVPKHEYARVLGDILTGEDDGAIDEAGAAATAQGARRRRKKDGFVNMMQRLERQGDMPVTEGRLLPEDAM